jgi:cardiolipin synthase
MQLMYLLAITAADRSLDLEMAYFVPDALSRETILAAIKRGVRVRIIVPGKHIDTDTARLASRAVWGDLLKAGVEIYEYQPTMFHCKVMVVDGYRVSVGSTNFDDRSFRLNDEENLNIFDEAFAGRQLEIFEADLKHAKRITYAEWQARPLMERVGDFAAHILGSQV